MASQDNIIENMYHGMIKLNILKKFGDIISVNEINFGDKVCKKEEYDRFKKYIMNFDIESGLRVPNKDAYKAYINIQGLTTWLNQNIEICDDRISKVSMLARVDMNGFKNGWESILPIMEDLELRYIPTLHCGMTPDNKKIRGGFEGCRWVAE
jgi:hypothetical protein